MLDMNVKLSCYKFSNSNKLLSLFCHFIYSNSRNNIAAFSLIELSIVLIIIGLLVAGVTGGASLIESARVQATINQFNNFKTSMLAFRAARDGLPGDVNDNGCIGYNQSAAVCGSVAWEATGDMCRSCGHYGGEYIDKNVGTIAGPFVDLYLVGLSNFKPNPDSQSLGDLTLPTLRYIGDIIPLSQIDKEQAKMYINYNDIGLHITHNTFDKDVSLARPKLDPEFLKKIDIKADDGKHDSGFIRSSGDYDTYIQENNKMPEIKFYMNELEY